MSKSLPTTNGLKYRTIVADPPWEHERTGVTFKDESSGNFISHGLSYETMTVDEIKALPVAEWAAPACHLYLWTTSHYVRDAFDVMRSWGFSYTATLVWCKASRGFGMGGTFQNNVEFVLFGKALGGYDSERVLAVTTTLAAAADARGLKRQDVDAHMGTSDMAGWWLSRLAHRCAVPSNEHWQRLRDLLGVRGLDDEVAALNAAKAERDTTQKIDTRWFTWPRGEHSAKPDAFLDIVEQASPGPYLELFARRARFNWDYWGDQSLNTAEVAA